LDSSFKGAVFTYATFVLHSNSKNQSNFKILTETFITYEMVFYSTKNFYLVEKFNEKIRELKASGIIEFIMSKYLKKGREQEADLRSCLKLDQLNGVFKMYFYCLLISSFVFLLEIVPKLKKSFYGAKNCFHTEEK
jgi:hypothetical protein